MFTVYSSPLKINSILMMFLITYLLIICVKFTYYLSKLSIDNLITFIYMPGFRQLI